MTRKLNFRFALAAMVLLAGAAVQIVREHRPSMLRPGLRLCAYVASAADGNVTVVDLVPLPATRSPPASRSVPRPLRSISRPTAAVRTLPLPAPRAWSQLIVRRDRWSRVPAQGAGRGWPG